MAVPRVAVLTAAVTAALLAVPPPARAAEPPLDLRIDVPVSVALTATSLAASLALLAAQDRLTPPHCRICGSNGFDTSLRDALRWRDTTAASRASDVLQIGVPALAAGALALSAWSAGGARPMAEDLLVTAEAISVAQLGTEIAKVSFARLRPAAWAQPGQPQSTEARLSLWSGHAAAAFAGVTAAATVARLRGYRTWPWIVGLGLAGAAACGWLRVAADEHWASDVLAGAAAGSLAGLGLPVWLHGRREEGEPSGGVQLRILPFAVAGSF